MRTGWFVRSKMISRPSLTIRSEIKPAWLEAEAKRLRVIEGVCNVGAGFEALLAPPMIPGRTPPLMESAETAEAVSEGGMPVLLLEVSDEEVEVDEMEVDAERPPAPIGIPAPPRAELEAEPKRGLCEVDGGEKEEEGG